MHQAEPSPMTRVIRREIEAQGLVFTFVVDGSRWMAEAHSCVTGDVYVAKADSESVAVAELAELVGIDTEE